ncbi:alkaline phosphatase [Salegentibacter salinarum]|uniref:Alkaline phosphatase n=2 Tax=Salegentibacter salinarum TaxID=447422 RepID=A0A2N0U4V4_9FLAO|nr:alkaline phosphatase [Salegentibacter salinarum]
MWASLFFYLCNFFLPVEAQESYQFHSHNDYKQEFPFWKAYTNKAASIEVDVFLKDNRLYVAHTEDEIQDENRLENLYLDPLKSLAKSTQLREIQLLIDIKTEAENTLTKLMEVLEGYPQLTQAKQLSIVISGNRPKVVNYSDYPDFVKFDHQDLNNLEQINLAKIALISTNFRTYSQWNGLGRLTAEDLEKVKNVIAKVKKVDKPFRFWGAPDTKTAWSRFAKMGVDLINTDNPAGASAYLQSLDKHTFRLKDAVPVYKPEFKIPTAARPENIILMIGDGNGLNQISSGMIANQGELTLTQLKDIGLVKTSSYDDLVTDSAAGGTAIATGNKTNNRAIGTGPMGESLKGLPEILAPRGFINGIITNDKITGATPSSFYAHVKERDNSAQILEDLKQSHINFFIANGKDTFNTVADVFNKKELSDFVAVKGRTAIFLSNDERLYKGNQFAFHVKKALQNLESQDKPYFLMIEGAKIDSNGHTNNFAGIVQEVIDFDLAVAEALKVADNNKKTLVVVTADHETSGLGIMQGDLETRKLEAGFLTNDHTATMVPIFSYGPKSGIFRGVYENTAIFSKILEALEIPE